VKICGITRPEDGVAAAECGAWAVGFVFHERSPRHVTARRASSIADVLPSSVLRVGVFLDATAESVREVEAALRLDLVQLHGGGAERTGRAVGSERVILAASLAREEDVERALELRFAFLLVDHDRSRPPSGDGTTDWRLAGRLAQSRAGTLLAGGLTPRNVARAIRRVDPFGVDVSRGVETSPGIKEPSRIRKFIESVRRADEA
jgi:phosphoribosylanthranilate isomerase